MKNEGKVLKVIFILQLIIFLFLAISVFNKREIVNAAEDDLVPFKAEVTAYNNPNGNKTSTGKDTIEGITIAGKPEWAGSVIALYFIDEDGSIGDFYGYREVTDSGYGHDSTIYPGKGTIETGETVDIFFNDYETAKNFGSKQMYIQVIPGVG